MIKDLISWIEIASAKFVLIVVVHSGAMDYYKILHCNKGGGAIENKISKLNLIIIFVD